MNANMELAREWLSEDLRELRILRTLDEAGLWFNPVLFEIAHEKLRSTIASLGGMAGEW